MQICKHKQTLSGRGIEKRARRLISSIFPPPTNEWERARGEDEKVIYFETPDIEMAGKDASFNEHGILEIQTLIEFVRLSNRFSPFIGVFLIFLG